MLREGLFYHIMVEWLEGWNEKLYGKLSYDFLIECAKNGKINEWNQAYEAYLRSEWERILPDEEYDLENIRKLIDYSSLFDHESDFLRPDYKNNNFKNVIQEGVAFSYAHLEGADFTDANLEGANFHDAHLEGACFKYVNLERADFTDAHLEGADFYDVHLEEANLVHAHLEEADLLLSHLEGANFFYAHIEGSYFNYSVVNGETLFIANYLNKRTDFTGTSLSSARIEPELRTTLERNIREIHWEDWYEDNKMLEIPAKVFWKISNYGSSTRDILFTFLFSNFIFTMIYLALRDANLLHGTILSSGNDILLVFMQTTLVPFGILGIDLTTLSPIPITIIFIQVILGYTILAALVTRMAIMFQNLSP